MADSDIDIRPTGPGDLEQIAELHALAFGPGRFARTAYRVREGASAFSAHCHGAWRGTALIGAVTLTAISVGGDARHWLLGPMAVRSAEINKGLGQRLGKAALQSIAIGEAVAATVILVGDLTYYGRLGFEAVPRGQIQMPGPVDQARLLIWRGPDGQRDVPAGMIKSVATG